MLTRSVCSCRRPRARSVWWRRAFVTESPTGARLSLLALRRTAERSATSSPTSGRSAMAKYPGLRAWRGARLSAARSFLKQHRTELSAEAIHHLESVVARLDDAMADESAQVEEEDELKAKGDELEEALAIEGGVYVYTFPQYWRYPTVPGTKRTLLKIGMTTREATGRLREQARGTAMPEEPLILRVYRSKTIEPPAAERSFHMLLNAAGPHSRQQQRGGREWFETSVEFLDTVASVLGLETLQAGRRARPRQAARRRRLAPTSPTRCSRWRSSRGPTRSASGPR